MNLVLVAVQHLCAAGSRLGCRSMANDDKLTEDKALHKVFKANHQNLKNVIDTLCEGWLVELENSDLKRIYVEGNVHYVSSYYYDQVDQIDGYRKAK